MFTDMFLGTCSSSLWDLKLLPEGMTRRLLSSVPNGTLDLKNVNMNPDMFTGYLRTRVRPRVVGVERPLLRCRRTSQINLEALFFLGFIPSVPLRRRRSRRRRRPENYFRLSYVLCSISHLHPHHCTTGPLS